MNEIIFSNIGKLIERDSKTTTYKFALLRGVIDIIQENSPFIKLEKQVVKIPLGLLIEKWLIYYYPIFESRIIIPQINGQSNLAFEPEFKKVIKYYSLLGGLSAFYNDLKRKGIPNDISIEFLQLTKKLKDTITKMPMKYIGQSINKNHYSIFSYESALKSKKINSIDLSFLIDSYGYFTIPIAYFEAFSLFGSFITGQDSILLKWAEFSVDASKNKLEVKDAINEIFKSPITQRDVIESKQLYNNILKKQGDVYCVWSGKLIKKFDVDHMIPFAIWKNNDLWNLFPSDSKTNNLKRDKVPSVKHLEKSKDLIFYYWELLFDKSPIRFEKELEVALLGGRFSENWRDKSFTQLKNACERLIKNRGYNEWNN